MVLLFGNMTLGDRLRESREACGLSPAAVAVTVGVHPLTLWRYETDRRMPPADVLGRLALALDISADALLGLTAPAQSSSTAQ